jgi:hypothetical protein
LTLEPSVPHLLDDAVSILAATSGVFRPVDVGADRLAFVVGLGVLQNASYHDV